MKNIHRKLEALFSQTTTWVYKRKYIAFTIMMILTLALASQLPRITIDTRDEGFFFADDPTLVSYNNFREHFGQDDTFIIALRPQNGLDLDFFAFLHQIHNEIKTTVPYIDEINSLVNGRVVIADGDTLLVEDLMKSPPQSDNEKNRVLSLINRYPLYDNLLVSEDRSSANIMIKAQAYKEIDSEDLLGGFEEATDNEAGGNRFLSNAESLEITESILNILENYQDRGVEIFFSGTPAIVADLQMSIEKDLQKLIPMAFSLMIVFLFLLFRRISGIIYPLIVVFLSLLASLGIMAVTGTPITLVSQILPSFLLVVGIGDSVHILAIFYRNYAKSGDKRQAIIDAVTFAGLPVLMTSITTSCGLISFTLADVANVAQLGYVAPAGVMMAFLYTVILLPALIAIFPVKQPRPATQNARPLADRIFDWISKITTRKPFLVSAVSGLIIAVALYGAINVRFSHNALTWFPKDSPIRIATGVLDEVNGGSVMLEALIDSNRENGLHEPDFMKKLDTATREIPNMEIHGISAGKAWSLADVIKETNRALNEDKDEAYIIPDSRQLIAQELILFESSGSDDLEDFTDSSYQISRLSIIAPFRDAILYTDYINQIRSYLEDLFPGSNVTLTGKLPLFAQMVKNLITSMAKSYIFAVVIITILMILLVGRVRIGLMSMVANVAPIIGILGLMGYKGIPMDMSTILIGSLILGLVVDDTIHFLHHFRRAYEESSDVEVAVRETLHTTGRALMITSMVLSGGFFIYIAAYLESNARYGILSGCAVLFALVADFFLIPALLSIVYGKKQTVKGDI